MTREQMKEESLNHTQAVKDLNAAIKSLATAKKTKDAGKITAARDKLEETLIAHHRHLSMAESAKGRKHLKGGRRTRRQRRTRRHTRRY